MRQGCLTFKHNFMNNESFVQLSNKINICFPQSNSPILFNPLFLCALYRINSLSLCSVKKVTFQRYFFSYVSLDFKRAYMHI